mmetsp:Transcript_5224/g.6167  ORF Transcript_5224/g.6167 Transcript_5224/m.6167 type:complete len:233 (+) Transcript_5224:3273-3971(+)
MLTSEVVSKIRDNLCVQEQLNSILLGATFSQAKKQAHFNSSEFRELVYEFRHCKARYLSQLKKKFVHNLIKVTPDDSREEPQLETTKNVWEEALKDYLLHSDEHWVLNQYNLLKVFVSQNSIEKDSSSLENFERGIYRPACDLPLHHASIMTTLPTISQDLPSLPKVCKVIDIKALFTIMEELSSRKPLASSSPLATLVAASMNSAEVIRQHAMLNLSRNLASLSQVDRQEK